MNSFSGRRPNERAKRIGRGLLEGLSAIGTAMADTPKLTRIEEIDQQIDDLRQERDHLIASLVDRRDYELSDRYDPRWRKPEVEEDTPSSYHEMVATGFGEGRLTQCKGREYSGAYHKAHPGCPYIDRIHGPHEFTLRD